MKALITTTINVPENLKKWTEDFSVSDVVVVAGDKKTPHKEVHALLDELACQTEYIDPHKETGWMCEEIIGYDSIQRRNLALLEAMKLGNDLRYITTIDDDNWPLASHFFASYFANVDQTLLRSLSQQRVYATNEGWYNVGKKLDPPVKVRGFPIELYHTHMNPTITVDDTPHIGVLASLWLDDPDTSAVERICCNPKPQRFVSRTNVSLAPGTWCPFNSQSTSYLPVLAPLMCVWPGVGRYDDIWGSLLAQRIMQELGLVVSFGRPLVRQDRNEHDPILDLEQELFGIRHTIELANVLRDTSLGSIATIVEMMDKCFEALTSECKFLPEQTLNFFSAWSHDVHKVLNIVTEDDG